MPTPRPTAEQERIVAQRVGPGDVAVVSAYAGSGKTTTLESYTRAHRSERFLYLCYNRALAEEARARFPDNVECRTTHSLALAEIPGNLRPKAGRPLDATTVRDILRLESAVTGAFALDTLNRFLASDDRAVGPAHVVAPEGASPEARRHVESAAGWLWSLMTDPRTSVPLPHDAYLKFWSLVGRPVRGHDVILLDEAQDTNPAVAGYVFRMAERGLCGVLAVGDSHQSIYSWRGAIDAMREAARRATAPPLSLTQCFRFGQSIADDASRVLAHLKGDSTALVGAGGAPKGGGRCFLARSNDGLLQRAIAAVSEGARVHFCGSRAEDGYSPMQDYRLGDIADIRRLAEGRRAEVRNPLIRRFGSLAELEEYLDGSPEGTLKSAHRIATRLDDEAEATVAAVCGASVGPEAADLHLSTAHKSKGREWDEVLMHQDFADPAARSLRARLEDPSTAREAAEEVNLLYVAMTRARVSCRYSGALRAWLDSGCQTREDGGRARGRAQDAAAADPFDLFRDSPEAPRAAAGAERRRGRGRGPRPQAAPDPFEMFRDAGPRSGGKGAGQRARDPFDMFR